MQRQRVPCPRGARGKVEFAAPSGRLLVTY
jgi:hypothetical protein